jgi:hypothetical protein
VIPAAEHEQRAVAHVEKAKALLERSDDALKKRVFVGDQVAALGATATAHATLALFHQREAERRSTTSESSWPGQS